MNIDKTPSIITDDSGQTEQLAKRLSSNLRGGEVIELVSDLGGGKTTFVRGLASGLGSKDHVSSPTFKICNVYSSSNLTIYHYDFYRLSEPGLIEHELHDAVLDDNGVIVIEWGQVIKYALPKNRLSIQIANLGQDKRRITFSAPKELQYALEGVC